MRTLATFDTEEILKLIGTKRVATIEGHENVKIHTVRLLVFKRSQICAGCGAKETVVKLQVDEHEQPFLNPFFIKNNRLVMMTMDHIVAKSLGGPTSYYNLQTMCRQCNMEKANKIDSRYLTTQTAQLICDRVDKELHPANIMEYLSSHQENHYGNFSRV